MSRIVKAKPPLIPGNGRGLRAVEQLAAQDVNESAATIALLPPDCDLVEKTAVGASQEITRCYHCQPRFQIAS